MKKQGKIKESEKVIKTYTIYCPVCNKEIIGYSPSQIEWNLDIHLKKCEGGKKQ